MSVSVSMVCLFALPSFVALGLWLVEPSARVSRNTSLVAGVTTLVFALQLVLATSDGSVVVHTFGGWPAPYGIVFAADRLSALFVAIHAVLLVVIFSALRPSSHGDEVVRRSHPLLLLLSAGLFGSFVTGDLFTLFVLFELVLVSSYLLLQVPGNRRSLAGALPTIVVNVLASALFLSGLGLLYGMTGSVNLAELTRELGAAPADIRRVALAMLITAFATKAGLVPLCFWMPATYPTFSAPLAALFAGIMTKLGVYALLRIQPLIALDPLLLDTLVWAGGASALLGVLAAFSQYEIRRLLSFHSVSQIGFMVFALGLGSAAGIAAAAFFAVHHSLVKSALYLVADELERRNASRDLRHMDFRRTRADSPVVACFIVAAFSLAGMPPLSGFFGKLSVFSAAFQAEPTDALTDVPAQSPGWPMLGMLLLILALGVAGRARAALLRGRGRRHRRPVGIQRSRAGWGE